MDRAKPKCHLAAPGGLRTKASLTLREEESRLAAFLQAYPSILPCLSSSSDTRSHEAPQNSRPRLMPDETSIHSHGSTQRGTLEVYHGSNARSPYVSSSERFWRPKILR